MDKQFEVKEAVEELGRAHAEFREKQVTRIDDISNRLTELETKGNRPPIGKGGNSEGVTHWRDVKSGALVPVLTKGRRLEEFAGETAPEFKGLSYGELIRAATLGDFRGLPEQVKSMGIGSGAQGGWLVPEPVGIRLIDMARNRSACMAAGAVTAPMTTETMTLAVTTQDPTAYWVGEHEEITESDAEIEPIKLEAKAVAAMVRTSREFLEDSPQAAQFIENGLSASLALEMDRVGLLGSGVKQPRGLENTPGINEVLMGANGAAASNYDHLIDAITAIRQNNGEPNAFILNAAIAGAHGKLKNGDGIYTVAPPDVAALRRIVSNQLPQTETQGTSSVCSSCYVGDFSQLLYGNRLDVRIVSGPYGTGTFAKRQILIMAYARLDVAVLRPNWFTRIKGLKAS